MPHKFVDRRAGDLAQMYANADLALKDLGWKTELTVEDAVKDTLNYLKSLV